MDDILVVWRSVTETLSKSKLNNQVTTYRDQNTSKKMSNCVYRTPKSKWNHQNCWCNNQTTANDIKNSKCVQRISKSKLKHQNPRYKYQPPPPPKKKKLSKHLHKILKLKSKHQYPLYKYQTGQTSNPALVHFGIDIPYVLINKSDLDLSLDPDCCMVHYIRHNIFAHIVNST